MTGARIAAGIKRSIEHKAARLLDGDESVKSTNGRVNQVIRAAANEIIERRKAEARQSCPVEKAKLVLQRRYAPVCSMAVYDGDPNLFCVGHRKDVTREQLLEMAEKVAA